MHQHDERLLRAAITASERALARGDGAFGAVLADADGNVLLEAENSEKTGGDPTGHAEINLIRLAMPQFDAATLAGCTLYASTEPCAMCCGSIILSPIRRVVFSLSGDTIRDRRGIARNPDRINCREQLERAGLGIEVVGPMMEDEAWAVVASGGAG